MIIKFQLLVILGGMLVATNAHASNQTLFNKTGATDILTRQKKLAVYFSPKPTMIGDALHQNRNTEELLVPRPNPADELPKDFYYGKLKGSIRVEPPKGYCFTITKSRHMRDLRVCKAENISFYLEDLNPGGVLQWSVSTGPEDTGTDLYWQTPHRIALVIDTNTTLPADSVPEFIADCTAFNEESGRSIRLTLFNGKSWFIKFPERDTLLPQPGESPGLYINDRPKQDIPIGSKSDPKKSPAPSPPPTASPSPTPTAATSAPAGNPPNGQAHVKRNYNADQPLGESGLLWTVSPMKTYSMSASGFSPFGWSTPGINGSCRYRFEDPKNLPVGGILECQNAPGYAYALVPLACAAGLQNPLK